MPLVPAQCPNCSGNLSVDSEKDAAICQYCRTPFIVEKAITQYNTNNNFNIDNVTIINSGIGDFEISGGVLKKYNGSSLTPVVPEGVVAIEGGVFAKSMITEVTLPSTLKEIRTDYFESPSLGAFWGCKYLERINLPEGLKIIGELSFCRCENLIRINIPSSVEAIGPRAFVYCKSIKEITIPDSVTSIGELAFDGCDNLEKVIIEGDTLKGFKTAFLSCKKLETALYKKNGVLVNPIEKFENIINSPFWHWKQVEDVFSGSIFYGKYCDLRNKEKRCSTCGADLSKRWFYDEYYCKNCDR